VNSKKRLLHSYVAGLFDGEGSVEFSKTFALRISITNTNKQILQQLQSQYGGNVKKTSYKPTSTNNIKQCWQWRIGSSGARHCLSLLIPYLVIKRKQAELSLLSQCNPGVKLTPKERRFKEWIRERIKNLKR
jgi:hypothetical protein